MQPLVIAHRGYSAVAPENTMASFQRAIAAGADGIEIDVHLTRDGKLVIAHDERLGRTIAGEGLIGEHTLDELLQMDAGGWFSPEFAGERVPTLEQVCAFCAEQGCWLNIEVKSGSLSYPGIEEAVWQMVKSHGIVERVFVSSFNHVSLRRLVELAPELAVAPLYTENMVEPWRYAQAFGATGLHPMHRTVTAELVREAHAAGVAVRPWTVDAEADLKRMLDCGVDAVITNQVERALSVLRRAL